MQPPLPSLDLLTRLRKAGRRGQARHEALRHGGREVVERAGRVVEEDGVSLGLRADVLHHVKVLRHDHQIHHRLRVDARHHHEGAPVGRARDRAGAGARAASSSARRGAGGARRRSKSDLRDGTRRKISLGQGDTCPHAFEIP